MSVRRIGRPKKKTEPSTPAGDQFELSGDFRGAVINIKSTLVGAAEAIDIEHLPPEPGDPPFQGLQYFDEKDSDRFFGREQVTARIIGRLHRTNFLAVIGASGSGKSSLVRAGVIPALKRGERLADGGMPPKDSSKWAMHVMTPTAHPLEALAASLEREAESTSAISTLQGEMAADQRALGLAIRRYLSRHSASHFLLVIDQFEELYTLCRSTEEQQAFIGSLLELADSGDTQPATILLVLRADFYAYVAQHDRLREIASQYQEFIGAMNRDELVSAIDKPLAQGGWKIQEGLIEVILDDIGYEPGALPLLSHALHETWRRRRGRTLTLSAYTESGGVRGAIAQSAENVFRKQLSEELQPVARMIFIRMAEVGEDSHDTRRRVNYSELITRSTDELVINTVIKILTDARLVTIGTVEPGGTKVCEVAHEALIREWPTLRQWLDEDRQGLILHQQLAGDTHDWINGEKDPGFLYRGFRLKQVQEWANKNADLLSLQESEFLDASQVQAEREAEQARRLARATTVQRTLIGLTLVLVVGILYLIYSAFIVREPAVMDGFYNIAVADISSTAGPDSGEARQDELDQAPARLIYQSLQKQLGDNPNILIWQDSPELKDLGVEIGPVIGKDEGQRAGVAAELARQLNADMVIYGVVDDGVEPPLLDLEFYLAPQPDYNYEDLLGSFSLDQSIAIVPGNDQFQAQIDRQASSLGWIALGLAEAQLGHSLEALEAFTEASKISPESALVQFFIGREYLFLVDRESILSDIKDAFERQAETAFQKAIALDPEYSRAYIGLGGLYFKRAQRALSAWMDENPGVDNRVSSLDSISVLVEQTIAQLDQSIRLGAQQGDSGVPLVAIGQLALGNTLRLKGQIEYFRGDSGAAVELIDRSIDTLDSTLMSLEDPGQKRFLTQAYEYLGSANRWLGYVYEVDQDYSSSLAAYQRAIEYFDLCIAQADGTQDLIIQNEIVGDICRPNRIEVQGIVGDLSGGQG